MGAAILIRIGIVALSVAGIILIESEGVRILLTLVAAVAVLSGSVTTPGLERAGQRRERGRAVGEDVEQSRSGAEPEATRPPVFFADGDLERCDAALSRFERAWGGGQDAPVRAALLGIAEAGGWKGDEWQLRELKQGRDVSDQAWRWLALMAEVASTEDPTLAGRIGLFFKVFSEEIGSKMKLADWFDYGLWSPSDAICTSALAHGINALGGVDPQTVVLRPVDVEPWDAATMRLVLCDGLLNRPDGDTPHESEARTIAASLLRQPPQMGPSRERRRRRAALPPDIIPRLESYGRVARNPELASEENYGLLEVELYQLAQADRDGLIEAVAEVARPAGGWATYGASRAIWSVVDPDVEGLEHPAYRELLTEGLEFLRDSGFDPVPLGIHERDHWVKTTGPP